MINQKGLASILIVILVALALGGYFIYTKSQLQPNSQPVTKALPQLPVDWVFKTSPLCNVALPLPPKKPPYYMCDPDKEECTGLSSNNTFYDDSKSGRYWQFEEFPLNFFFTTNTSWIIFRADGESGGDYTPAGIVEVRCAPNDQNYDTNTLLSKFEADLAKDNQQLSLVRQIKDKQEVDLWGKKVISLSLDEGDYGKFNYYLLATPKHLFMVYKVAGSQTQSVIDTTDQIFNNLQFLD